MAEPKVRFKREDGSCYPAWEQGRFGDLIEVYDEKVSSDCTLPVLTSSKTDGIQYQSDHFGREQLHDITGYNVIPRGYCTYRNRSDGTDFTFNINNLCDRGIVSKFYPVFHATARCNLYFLMTLMNNESKTVRKIAMTAKGTGQKVLSFLDLQKIEISIPSLEEQQKIADFLSSVDEIVFASEEEVANLEKQKKAVMKKIFSQEVRFKREDGSNFPEWEEKRVDELTILNPKTPEVPQEFYYMDLGGINHGMWLEKNVLIKDNAPSRAQRVASEGDVFFQSVRPYNMGHYLLQSLLDKTVVASTGFIQMRCNERILNRFLFQYLFEDNLNKEVNIRCTGQAYPAINADVFGKIVISIPCFEEQRLIADFLSDFDEAIAAAKKELELWKELKKGLLQQMFV